MAIDEGSANYYRYCYFGDETGLINIIKDYKNGLILFINHYVNNIHIAEELAEDTFVLLGTKKPKDNNKGVFKTWLYTIGRNIAIDYLRKESKHKSNKSIDDYKDIADLQDIEKEYLHKERDELIHQSLKTLKPEYRQILWLIYFENLNYKECAKIMKKSVHSIESLAYRARASLKSILEQEGLSNENL